MPTGVAPSKHCRDNPMQSSTMQHTAHKYFFSAVMVCCIVAPSEGYTTSYKVSNIRSEIKRNTQIPRTIRIHDEYFDCAQEDHEVIITHPKWSIMGIGKDLQEAKIDLKTNAELIASDYINEKDSDLTNEAIKLKAFLIKYFS